MKTLNGNESAKKILLNLKKKIAKLNIKPVLAIILAGNDEASELYVKLKRKAAERIGIKIILYRFGKNVKEKDIIKKIKLLNESKKIHGIIVQLPLPKGINPSIITEKISSRKDVDGFHKKSLFAPVLPEAILIALKKSSREFSGKKILALVNSEIFGKTLKRVLDKEKIKIKYVLRKKLSRAKLKPRLKSADVVITVCGIPNLIKSDMIKKGAILIDAGIKRFPDKKVLGDVDREGIKNKASFLTPPKGGIGPITVALLLKNTYHATKYSQNNRSNLS